MNAEHERTWREMIADVAEQKRRAELFPELVRALDALVSGMTHRSDAANAALALLVRCRKPTVQP